MKMRTRVVATVLAAASLGWAASASAQAPQRPEYGQSLNLQDAMALAATAEAAARAMKVPMAIAVVEPSGEPVLMHKMDGTQYAAPSIALDKARSAARFRRPTKEFEGGVTGGRNALLGLPGAVPIEGGVLVLRGGRIVGAIGLSGGTSVQDHQIGEAAAAAFK